jgi:parallel beta-helix repeat protein
VLVGQGTYAEAVQLKQSRVTSRAASPSDRPRIDGGRTRKHGIHMADGAALEDVVIEGFEIAEQTDAGIYAGVGQARRFVIRNNLVHHIRAQGIWLGGTGHLVEKNVIYTIGNDQEARGVLLSANYRTEAADCTARGNQIYLCKKEGIRDYGGHGNLIEGNVIYGCTYGISLNATRGGTRVLNNYISKVIHGYNPKHTTGEHGWNVFWHNTVYDSAYWAISIGSPPTGDFVDVRNNILARSGEAHIMHALDATGPNVRIDGNLHCTAGTRPRWSYVSYPGPKDRLADVATLRAKTGFEARGLDFDPGLLDPERGDLDYPSSSRAAAGSLSLPSPYGKQLGARGLKQTTPTLIRLPLTAVAASAHKDLMQNTTDNLTHTYWVSAPHNRDQWILYDLGAEKAFQYIVLVPYQHKVQYNVRKYAFDVSNDAQSFRRITAGQNNDSGSIFIYEFDPPARGRFLRFNMLENFPDDGLDWTVDAFVVSDLWVANLVPRNAPEARSPLGRRAAF